MRRETERPSYNLLFLLNIKYFIIIHKLCKLKLQLYVFFISNFVFLLHGCYIYIMEDLIIKKLINNIKETNKNKSSYWEEYLKEDLDFLNESEFHGFAGNYTKKSLKNIAHSLLIKIIYGNQIFKTETYSKYKSIYDKIDRFVDSDTIRHIFTFEKIKRYLNPKKICIIGDGKLNAVLGAHLTFPLSKIYSINLSEILINDYLILQKTHTNLKNSVELIDDLNFIETGKKLSLIPSNFKNKLLDKKIDLFINIASFQEMTINEIDNYFEIIKNNNSKLYCCNREYKKLSGGEELYFEKYPWANASKNFWEDCPWHQKNYSLRPPFIHNYAGNVKHCLVDFS